jgi:4-hydroxybenzoate polyprenyltransferase
MRIAGILRWVVFSNIFYGISVLALQWQTAIVLSLPFANPWFYLATFSATLLYYSHAYLFDTSTDVGDERMQWYRRNAKQIRVSQAMLTFLLLIATWQLLPALFPASFSSLWPAIVFPLLAALYFGGIQPGKAPFNLRKYGWLKPIIIALVWGGIGTLIPEWWASASLHQPYIPSSPALLLLLQQGLFILVLSILFDVKDYAADHNLQIKTWAIRVGPGQLLRRIILPIAAMGVIAETYPCFSAGYPPYYALLNTIPWVLLIFACQSLTRHRSVVHYLWVIDGLIPLKAVIGIIAHLLIN